MQHAIIHQPITDLAGAHALLTYLADNGLSYHCEERAEDCLRDLVTPEEASALNTRMAECYALDWPADQCPCGFTLELDPDYLRNAIENRRDDGDIEDLARLEALLATRP